jgi:N6-L-threonylcarbamoyladenine synthase
MNVLGIETSCDETSAAVASDGRVVSNVISSQLIHASYGGVVPELASRAHIRMIVPVVEEALARAGVQKENLDAVAVTHGPGLAGALIVGLCFAKALAYSLKIPFIGVNHLEGHLYSNFLSERSPSYPFISLIISGGHTLLVHVQAPFAYRVLGETRDDAAGEAFDKVAKMLGLTYPGGPVVDKLAQEGNPSAITFPRSYLEEGSYDFSFSGIKTSVLYYLRNKGLIVGGPEKESIDRTLLADICASFQEAIIDVLVEKTIAAAEQTGTRDITMAGGVSANSRLRHRMKVETERRGMNLYYPRVEYCMDNGAMIAYAGWLKRTRGMTSDYALKPVPNLSLLEAV